MDLEDALFRAAGEVLVENGFHGFTYEAVAARAGTSRPVLYRRWPQRQDMLLSVLTWFLTAHPIAIPDTGDLRRDAIELLNRVNVGRAQVTALVGPQLLEYFRETGADFTTLQKILHPGEATGFELLVTRAVERGELKSRPRSARVVNLPLDLLRHDIVTTLRKVSKKNILEIVDDIWLPLLRRSV